MTSEPDDDLDRLARDLGLLIARLLQRTRAEEDGTPHVGSLIIEHLGEGATAMPLVSDTFSAWDQANLQLAIDAATTREGWSVRPVGISGQARHYGDVGLGDIMNADHFAVGPVEHATAEIGPGKTLACVDFAVLLIDSPDGALAAFVQRVGDHFGGASDLRVQVATRDRAVAEAFLGDLRRLIGELDVFRGQVVTIEEGPAGTKVVFVERPDMDAGDLVLPPGVLERIERHLAGPSVHREQLLAMGRHLARGLLLWGPPGTGKTHTVRYLTGRLRDATVIILSGGSLGSVGAFGTMARRLAPSVVILEDVDLVAEERSYDGGGSAILFELMNQMSGLGEDADVAFVLTTNRPDALEPALAARPGRIDLAVEIPLPDADSRAALLALYGRGLDLRLTDGDAIVARTEGVTASFMKELLRKATLGALIDGREHVTDADVTVALDELLSDTGALTRVLLGAGGDGDDDDDGPSDWLRRFPRHQPSMMGVMTVTVPSPPSD